MKKSLVLILVALFVFSCGNKKEASKVEIVQWSEIISPTIPLYKTVKASYDSYMSKHPETPKFSSDFGPALYRERAQRYLLQGKSGIPDILEGTLEQVYSYIAANMADPIEEYFNNDSEKNQYYENLIEALTVNGHLYAIPDNANVRLLVYRKDLLEKHNLKVPATWDELITVAKTLKEKEGINGFMFTTQTKEVRAFQEFMSFYFTLADNIYKNENGKITYIAKKEHFAEVLQLYKTLFDVAIDPNAKSQDWKAVDYGVTGGQTAMVTVGPWIWGHLNEDATHEAVMTNLHVAPIPTPKNGERGTYMEVKGLVFNPHAAKERRQDAYNAARVFVSQEFLQTLTDHSGAMPIRKDVKSDNYFIQGFANNLSDGKVLEFINWDMPQNYIVDAIQSVIYNKATPSQAADKLEKELKAYEKQALPQ